jgi:hypothetical protein
MDSLMIIYLDQNKWIQLARIENGVDESDRGERILSEFNAAIECGYIFPLSAIHIVEFSRIKDPGRRARLGRVMWKYSQGYTIAPLKEVLCWEIEKAFSVIGYAIKPRSLHYIGRGILHTFGEKPESRLASMFADNIDEAMLCGLEEIPPIEGASSTHRENFVNHLQSLNDRKHELKKSKWENWLYAITMMDIAGPLYEVMSANRIPNSDIESWGEEKLKEFLSSIPTRNLDIHLHRQVLRNSSYKPKHSDLEDWAGLGPAACYSDVLVCEKHFADMVKRDSFKTKARIETSIYKLFSTVTV